ARVYRELEAAGLVRTQGRAGTFVHTDDAATAAAQAAAHAYAAVVHAHGIGTDDAVRLVRTALDQGSARQ
ncbi:MAG: GntR family transcriptional regulator, partial [Jatrophihabitans endophyticus]|nr:GntR family transcriptional regulator [Jatrophihabitans endophyticus]